MSAPTITNIEILMGLTAMLMGVVLYGAWRVWVTLIVLQPVVARLAGSDYRDAARNFDRGARWVGSGTEPLVSLHEDDTRPTDLYWHYTDAEGERHEVTLSSFVQRGAVPDAARMLWIDPTDPARVTRLGPGFWSVWTIAAAGALGWLLWTGPRALESVGAVV